MDTAAGLYHGGILTVRYPTVSCHVWITWTYQSIQPIQLVATDGATGSSATFQPGGSSIRVDMQRPYIPVYRLYQDEKSGRKKGRKHTLGCG